MIEITDVFLKKVMMHRVSYVESQARAGEEVFDLIDETLSDVLKNMFLKPFTNNVSSQEFHHTIDLNFNVLFSLSKQIRENGNFIELSKKIFDHLMSVSDNANIKDGDVFVARFDDIKLNENFYEGLGIFKFEDKQSFVETDLTSSSLTHSLRKGIGAKKPEKAVLILFTEEPYNLLVIDNSTAETDYWQNKFIGNRQKADFVNNTTDLLLMAKNFITEQIPQEFDITRADQIDLLNKSFHYFKEKESFDMEEFSQQVIANDEGIAAFKTYKQAFDEGLDTPIPDSFDISEKAVKKQAKAYKSVLKLDKNFHIYIHGDKELIENGFDDGKRMNYYKVYYHQEE
ncbi:nucleoid-associated protein [Pedobacter frigoris]|uniref:Nucleoid-associated protein n=1 Tax=Pedobacter frigoris TaxID=2571272 RepID=A0A4U1CJ42_9SPHI|nr:nucleoid-associated protein [Pedobacter frigoris]TKC06969.1 nucleoid-associated protein [Pedobacter frigoris]